MFQGIDHVAIAAADPAALIAWYCDVLGFQVVWSSGAERPVAIIGGPGGSTIEMMPDNGEPRTAHEPFDPGFRHLAIRVSDFDAAMQFLQSKGVAFLSEPVVAAGGGQVVSFHDPEGNMVQIVARPAGFRGV